MESMRSLRHVALTFAAICGLVGCATDSDSSSGETNGATPEITVAAASNFRQVFDELGGLFTDETGIAVTFVYGSSGLLREQIINGAPYDVYASASSEFVDELVATGRGQVESRQVFALGRLALWTNDSRTLPATFDDLQLPIYQRIVIANPETAPYGLAARDALENRGLWTTITDRLVLAENIGDAFRIVQSGNADIGLIALSLIITGNTDYLVVPAELHRPLDHTLVVLTAGRTGEAGQEFANFIVSERGRQLLAKYGFGLPDTANESPTPNSTK